MLKHAIVFAACLLASAPTMAKTNFFGNRTITNEEFIGCAQQPNDSKCGPLIAHGCSTVCRSTNIKEDSNIYRACEKMCPSFAHEWRRTHPQQTAGATPTPQGSKHG
ncbi:MAG: hypothetical protein ACPGXY_03225 [Alphaproteobacteria bacterium]